MKYLEKNQFPDTLDLEDRAKEAINAMLGIADDMYEYIPFFNGNLMARPAYMVHGNWDFGSSHGRLVDSLILARFMCNIAAESEIEKHYRSNLLSFFREDGLSYRRNTFDEETIKEHQSEYVDSASMIDQRAVIMGLTTWYLTTGDEKVKTYADRLCAALKRIARKERECWYYPASEYTPRGWPSFDAVHTRLTVDPAAMWGRQIGPLLKYHILTGNKDAYELAERFASNIIYRSGVFNKDGSFNGALEYRNGHFHTRMGTLASLARFAVYTGDASIIEFVKRSYDWALKQCTSFGWTPGDMHDQRFEHETCTLVDAIDIGIILAQSGYTEYWGVVERFIRNHLTESQLLDISWIEELDTRERDIPKRRTYYKVAQRLRGAFAGYSAPNDFVYSGEWGRGHIMDTQTCCIASGVRGLYLGWSSIITEKNKGIYINMLLNKASKWLDLKSYMPHEGKVELDINRDLEEVFIRIPDWVPYGAVKITRKIGDEEISLTGRALSWTKRCFMKIENAREGEKILLTFPLKEYETLETASGLEYKVRWRGDDVIHIDPPGIYCPLYNRREIYQESPVKTKEPIRKDDDRIYF